MSPKTILQIAAVLALIATVAPLTTAAPPTIVVATLYSDALYQGSSLDITWPAGKCLYDNLDIALSGFWDNNIGSIRVMDSACRVAGWDGVFGGPFFRCYAWATDGTVLCPNLYTSNWADRISSIRVESAV